MFQKLQLHEQENSTNKKQQSIVVYIGLFTRPDMDKTGYGWKWTQQSIVVYIGLFTRPDMDENEHINQ